ARTAVEAYMDDLDARSAAAVIRYQHFLAARHFRDRSHRQNVLNRPVSLLLQRFDASAIPADTRPDVASALLGGIRHDRGFSPERPADFLRQAGIPIMYPACLALAPWQAKHAKAVDRNLLRECRRRRPGWAKPVTLFFRVANNSTTFPPYT